MFSTRSTIATTALAGLLSVASFGIAAAADTLPLPTTLKPIAGNGAAPGQPFLLNVAIGAKQAVGYFESRNGACKLTLMVGQAFDGENVPQETPVRFDVEVSEARTALFNTAEGKGIEFTCLDGAQAMGVRALDQIAGFPSSM
ncbi:MAG: hypothetical protein AB7E66_16790 [Parvibaculaceae bacterium]